MTTSPHTSPLRRRPLPASHVPRPHDVLLRPVRGLGRLRARWWAEDLARPAVQGWVWTLLLAALLVGVALRLGATDWYTDYPVDDLRLPNTFASIDHPFHIARERATFEALSRGWLPRWFSNQQGGSPAEFYPTGGAVIVALVYLFGLGLIPLAVCHKLVVIGVLLVPPLAYWAIARRERLPLSVAVLAAGLHLFLPGTWVAGGSDELLGHGLWPNVLASYLPLVLILWGADYLRRGDRRGLLLATGVATLAIYTNPRSLLGVAVAGAAVGLVAASEHLRLWPVVARLGRMRNTEYGIRNDEDEASRAAPASTFLFRIPHSVFRIPLLVLAGRAALLTVLVGLLSAALLLPLWMHQHLYHFTHYVQFESARQIWDDYTAAVPLQVIALAGLGVVVGLLRRGFYGRVFAVLLPLSYLVVTLVGWQWRDQPVFAQLEGPRLLPLLRPATIFLAALGVHEAARALLRLVRLPGATVLVGGATILLAAFFLLASQSPLPPDMRGLPRPETTNEPATAAIARSALIFAASSTPADKALVIGNPVYHHASFWIPAFTGRDVYHDDWLWFWRRVDYSDGEKTQFRAPIGALELDFLARHGLTMLLLDARWNDLLDFAATRPYLRQLDPGTPGGYALYRVEAPPGAPNGWITFSEGTVTALEVQPEHLVARGHTGQPGVARIMVNHFPRWRAQVNGEPAPIARSEEGYMQVAVPAGEVTVALDYVTEPAGWLARGLVALGLLLLLALTVPPTFWRGTLRHALTLPRAVWPTDRRSRAR